MSRIVVFILFSFVILLGSTNARAGEVSTKSKNACTPNESWSFDKNFSIDQIDRFRAFLGGGNSARGFASAVSLRKQERSPEEKLFAQYWISRALLVMGDVHGAYGGFVSIAQNRPSADSVGILIGAVECINQIRDKYASLLVNGPSTMPVDSRLLGYFDFTDRPGDLQTIWKFAISEFRLALPEQPDQRARLGTLTSVLQGSGIHESLARGLLGSARLDFKETIAYLPQVLSAINANAPGTETYRRYVDQIHLLLARAYFTEKRFPEAMNELVKIEKSSNELAEGLSELAWSALMAGKYSEAIGAAINLQAGGLRRTFAPESPMVMAMALDEICQYPESLRAVSMFRTAYQPSYQWLSTWKSAPNEDLYSDAVAFLRKRHSRSGDMKNTSAIPERVASEWVRSPVFISSQEEINLIVDEKQRLKKVSREASNDQKQMSGAIRAHGKALRADLARFGKGTLPSNFRKSLTAFRMEVENYRDFRKAAGPFRNIAQGFEAQASKSVARLKTSISSDFARRNDRMLSLLEEIAENNQLIEVEIYNGASGDIIWQNAHPDYKQIAQKMRQDQIKVAASRVWNWGHAPALSDGWSEIWEDELGSFKSDLYDNCSSRQKYLAIKKLNFSTQVQNQAKAETPGK